MTRDRTAAGAEAVPTSESGAKAPPKRDRAITRAAVLGEPEPLDRLAASLYNKPAVPTFTEALKGYDPWGQPRRGTKFLRWHELSGEQKDRVRKQFAERLDEVGVVVAKRPQTEPEAESVTPKCGAGGEA